MTGVMCDSSFTKNEGKGAKKQQCFMVWRQWKGQKDRRQNWRLKRFKCLKASLWEYPGWIEWEGQPVHVRSFLDEARQRSRGGTVAIWVEGCWGWNYQEEENHGCSESWHKVRWCEKWMQTVELDQGWTHVLTGGPRWVLEIDRGGAGAGADRWSVLVTHLIGEENDT